MDLHQNSFRKPQAGQRRNRPTVRPTIEEADRQNRLIQSAWAAFRDRDTMIAFLNGHHHQLGDVPLRLALASDQGLEAVERYLAEPAQLTGTQRAP